MATLTADSVTKIIMSILPKDCSGQTMAVSLDILEALKMELVRTRDYAVYATDTDGSSRKACTVYAQNEEQAKSLAAAQGVKRIEYAIEVE
jgi:hypothetical protein